MSSPSHSQYSWHQSHDQATVLFMVPYDASNDDIIVLMEPNYILAGVRGQPPVVKGRLYGSIDTSTSIWQLESRSSRLSARERTTSTTSTLSTHSSSYAFVSDPEISSSFAASLDSAHASDAEDPMSGFASPSSPASDNKHQLSRAHSPNRANLPSAASSLESLQNHRLGRLLTLHLEKAPSSAFIWTSLITGPAPEALSPCDANTVIFNSSSELEHQYNMDPTSLSLIALDLHDMRKDKEEAFECFIRAWHQARVPSATMRLALHYLPPQFNYESIRIDPTTNAPRGTILYYYQCIGGSTGLAQLYLEAGMLHLDGSATSLLTRSFTSLSSIRLPPSVPFYEVGAETWKRDREAATRFFDRARSLHPELEVPTLSGENEIHLEMPTLEVFPSAPQSVYSSQESQEAVTIKRRKGKDKDKEAVLLFDKDANKVEGMDGSWFFYVPSLIGAGTALLVVGVVGALSLSNWRKSQGY